MAASRSSAPADPPGEAVLHAVSQALARHPPGQRMLVAVSGGRDSVALLAAIVECGRVANGDIVAAHVNHGLSAHADAWSAFCAQYAASLGVGFRSTRVNVRDAAVLGIEDAARRARYAALRAAARDAGAATIALAHHQDDQAETLLLQLLRGAGPAGLAGMPAERRGEDGVLWLRPLLDVRRSAIDAFVQARRLAHIDDDSNASDRHLRNALRQRVVPAIAGVCDGYPATIARAARHQAEAAQLADDLAALDATGLLDERSLDRAGLRALPAHRARNLLRYFLRSQRLRAPSTARLAAMLQQFVDARDDARVGVRHDGVILGVHRGRIVAHAAPPATYAQPWRGEALVALPHGTLAFVATRGAGVRARAANGHAFVVRPRSGGERLQPHGDRPRRALKSWLQEAGMPGWEREALPLLFLGDTLVAVPGIGVDLAFQAQAGETGYALDWRPRGGAER